MSILREENKRFQEEKIEWMALIDEKNQKIVDLTDQILKQRFTSASFQFMEKDKRASSLEMMLMDVGEERNKLRNRIELLREELDSQYKENEENLKKLQNKFEDETQENFKARTEKETFLLACMPVSSSILHPVLLHLDSYSLCKARSILSFAC